MQDVTNTPEKRKRLREKIDDSSGECLLSEPPPAKRRIFPARESAASAAVYKDDNNNDDDDNDDNDDKSSLSTPPSSKRRIFPARKAAAVATYKDDNDSDDDNDDKSSLLLLTPPEKRRTVPLRKAAASVAINETTLDASDEYNNHDNDDDDDDDADSVDSGTSSSDDSDDGGDEQESLAQDGEEENYFDGSSIVDKSFYAYYAEFLDDNVVVIPPPDKGILRMSCSAVSQVLLKDVVEPCAEALFMYLWENGFIRPVTSKLAEDVTLHPEDERTARTTSRSVVYMIVNNETLSIKKVGSTKNATNREALSEEKGVLQSGESLHEIYNLDLITKKADSKAQNTYYDMMKRLVAHVSCPAPLRHVLTSHLNRGGDAFFKKNTILQIVEYGAKCYFKCADRYTDFEFLMYDEQKYQGRADAINSAWNMLKPKMEEVFGADGKCKVGVKQGSGWKPGGPEILADGSPRLLSTQVAMENIMGHPVDMAATDMVNVPAYPGTTKRSEMYSFKGYSAEQLRGGMDKFNGTIVGLQARELLDLDTCQFLFSDDPRGSLKYLLTRGYRIVALCWNFEAVLLVNGNKAIWLHLPYCKAALGVAGSIEAVVLRNMLIQLTTMMVAWCQGDSSSSSSRATMNTSFHDANLAAYQYEHAVTACHSGRRYAASSQRDVMTPKEVMAMVQTDLPHAPCDGTCHPIAQNLRKAAWNLRTTAKSKTTNKSEMKINHLALPRAVNVFLTLPNLTKPQVTKALDKVKEIFEENGTKKKTIGMRWDMLFKKVLRPKSKLLMAIKRNMPTKKNKGNPKARGLNSGQKKIYADQLQRLKAKGGTDDKFWVRLEKDDSSPPVGEEKQNHEVFDGLVFRGVSNNMKRVDTKYPFMIFKVPQKSRNGPSIVSSNGGFVLCELKAREVE